MPPALGVVRLTAHYPIMGETLPTALRAARLHAHSPGIGKVLPPALKATQHNTRSTITRKVLPPASGAARLKARSTRMGKDLPPAAKPSGTTCIFPSWRRLFPLPTDTDQSHHRLPLAGWFIAHTPFSWKFPRSWPRSPSRWRIRHSISHPSLLESPRWCTRDFISSRLPSGVGVVCYVGPTVHCSLFPLDDLGGALA